MPGPKSRIPDTLRELVETAKPVDPSPETELEPPDQPAGVANLGDLDDLDEGLYFSELQRILRRHARAAESTEPTALEPKARVTHPEIEGMTTVELEALLDATPTDRQEWPAIFRALQEVVRRERFASLTALPDDAQIKVSDAAWILDIIGSSVLSMIHKGILTGTKVPRGPRGFYWTVPIGEVRRITLAKRPKTQGA